MFQSECKRLTLCLDALEWGQTADGFAKGLYSLAYTIGGTRRVETFTIEELSDAPHDQAVRGRLCRRVTATLAALVPPKRIGF
jgi:hypothetical protein